MISYKKFVPNAEYNYANNFLILKNMDLLAETITKHCWSPEIWRDNIRKKANFESAHFLVLDFDEPGDESMDELNRSLCDHKRIFGTTKSHMKSKNGIVCERYRLIIPFEKPITSLSDYLVTLKKAYERFPWADKACIDAARFYFPCQKIVYFDREAEYKWETSIATYTATHTPAISPRDGKIPSWCLNFINNGAIYNGSRNLKVFAVARELFRQGFSESDTRCLIMRAPINWDGVGIESILKSAKGKV